MQRLKLYEDSFQRIGGKEQVVHGDGEIEWGGINDTLQHQQLVGYIRWSTNRVGGVVAFPASHTTVHAGPHTAVHHPLRIDW